LVKGISKKNGQRDFEAEKKAKGGSSLARGPSGKGEGDDRERGVGGWWVGVGGGGWGGGGGFRNRFKTRHREKKDEVALTTTLSGKDMETVRKNPADRKGAGSAHLLMNIEKMGRSLKRGAQTEGTHLYTKGKKSHGSYPPSFSIGKRKKGMTSKGERKRSDTC